MKHYGSGSEAKKRAGQSALVILQWFMKDRDDCGSIDSFQDLLQQFLNFIETHIQVMLNRGIETINF